MTNDDSKTIEKDEILDRLVEEKRYKDAYQRCIEMIARKEHVSYAKLTMRSLIDKIDAKEYRKDTIRAILSILLLGLLIIVVSICKDVFHLNNVVTFILAIVAFLVPTFVSSKWVRIQRGRYYNVPGIRLEYTPQITVEKICRVLKESLPGCTLQIQKNLIKVTSAQNDVDGQILLSQNEKRRFTTIVVNVRMKEWYRLDSSVGRAFLSNLLNGIKDGIPNMIDDSIPNIIDDFSGPEDQPKHKKPFRIVLDVVVVAGIAALLFYIKFRSHEQNLTNLFISKPRSHPEQSLTNSSNGHEWVDLGLPSGTLWATCNMGASSPEGYGNYYAWGETSTKGTYNWSTYQYANGDYNRLTKYCNKSDYGDNGFTDNLTTLQSGDDPATANWDSGWCTPSKAQWDELLANTTSTWTTKNGVKGRQFTSKKNGQTLFLPAAGGRWDSELSYAGSDGNYWSRSLYSDYPGSVWYLYFNSGNCDVGNYYRYYGFSVRPVRQN